jgi:hypothetical protein
MIQTDERIKLKGQDDSQDGTSILSGLTYKNLNSKSASKKESSFQELFLLLMIGFFGATIRHLVSIFK